MTAHDIVLGLMVTAQAIGSLVVVATIGTPRKPITPGNAVFSICFGALWVWGLLYLAGAL